MTNEEPSKNDVDIEDINKKLSYNESDLPNPLTKYGVSKLKGEEAIRSILIYRN